MRNILLLLIAATCPVMAGEKPVSLSHGDPAPDFRAVNDSGEVWESIDHVGKQVIVVYFYPADLTKDCTKQACGFQKRLRELKEAGVTVVGVSGDKPANHQLFKKLHSLEFPLLSDEDGKVSEAFGVPIRQGGQITRVIDGQQKTLSRGVTAQRWTFVIGLDGTIIHKNTQVSAEHDCDSVFNVVRQLTASTQ